MHETSRGDLLVAGPGLNRRGVGTSTLSRVDQILYRKEMSSTLMKSPKRRTTLCEVFRTRSEIRSHLTESVYNVVVQKSIHLQIRQLILDHY